MSDKPNNSRKLWEGMNLSLWFFSGVMCLSVSWLFGLHYFVSENYAAFASFITVGTLLLFPPFLSRPLQSSFDNSPKWLIVPLLLTAYFLPWPYRTAPLVIAAGIVLLLGPMKKIRISAVGHACILSGTILMGQSALLRLHDFLFSGCHDAPWLAKPLALVLNFLGTDAASSDGIVFVKTIRNIQPFRVTWEALASLPFILFFSGMFLVLLLFHAKGGLVRALAKFAVLIFLLFLLRYVLLILFYVYSFTFIVGECNESGVFIFWTPLFIVVSLSPIPFLLRIFFAPQWADEIKSAGVVNIDRLLAAFLSVSVFTFVFSYGFQDPGHAKGGRILFDSSHSKWEPFERSYDTKWYGHDSGYNYAAMHSFLSKCYDVTDSNGELTDELLSRSDILILKIPTAPFSEKERWAIRDFVYNGGGLFMLGEHTNVFGSGAYLNPIAKMFGISFDYNCVFDIETKFEQTYKAPKILPHPVVAQMPDFLFEVSCSIRPESFFVEPVIRSGGLKTLDIDYSSRNFYPQVVDSVNMRFGTFTQTAARKYGKGRVVAFSDSTCYSNFSAFHQGKPEFLLGTLSWLNRRNSVLCLTGRTLVVLSFCTTLFCFLIAFLFCRKKSVLLPYFAVWAGAAAVFSILSVDKLNRHLNPVKTQHKLPATLAFEREHCDYDLPDNGFVKKYDRSFGIFHQWILRTDHFPRTFRKLDDCLRNSQCLVLIRPDKAFSTEEYENIENYVRKGGKLLVLDDAKDSKSAANLILGKFGLSFESDKPIERNMLMTAMGRQILCYVTNVMPVKGGTPVLYSTDGLPLATFVKYGEGLVVASSLAESFSDSGMGVVQNAVPNDDLAMVYAVEFALVRGIMSGNMEEHLKKIISPLNNNSGR